MKLIKINYLVQFLEKKYTMIHLGFILDCF